ncbi:pentapeptide repeat-containing protein [Streptomyces microflavus]|uniref:pentapeptide repeat-containing protein n=1 Tax=Streptomyces microflavus TaxID=1919 RepID=UPI00225A9BB4|nr:pentapeptide repeat-containing protein [Streptomyces microflavus]MCX4657606.1 pentapeptide repeat-containing protein [Streptomyces microflavus]
MDWARRIELFTVVVASVVAVVGLWYSNVQTRQANEQARDDRALAKEGQITDRYTAAVGNLGEDKIDVRLGGIYALERIMQDSRRDQPTIANVLATYIRTHTTKPPAEGQGIPADVQAALTVLTTRDTSRDGAFLLDLHGAKLPNIPLTATGISAAALHKANLRNTDLSGANLRDVDLHGADLRNTNLNGANLRGANLRNTDLSGAILSGAYLRDTYLGDALLYGAYLLGANLSGANLSGADLRGADLRDTDLTKQQVDSAVTDSTTRLR